MFERHRQVVMNLPANAGIESARKAQAPWDRRAMNMARGEGRRAASKAFYPDHGDCAAGSECHRRYLRTARVTTRPTAKSPRRVQHSASQTVASLTVWHVCMHTTVRLSIRANHAVRTGRTVLLHLYNHVFTHIARRRLERVCRVRIAPVVLLVLLVSCL